MVTSNEIIHRAVESLRIIEAVARPFVVDAVARGLVKMGVVDDDDLPDTYAPEKLIGQRAVSEMFVGHEGEEVNWRQEGQSWVGTVGGHLADDGRPFDFWHIRASDTVYVLEGSEDSYGKFPTVEAAKRRAERLTDKVEDCRQTC